jgi:hypothetical protein
MKNSKIQRVAAIAVLLWSFGGAGVIQSQGASTQSEEVPAYCYHCYFATCTYTQAEGGMKTICEMIFDENGSRCSLAGLQCIGPLVGTGIDGTARQAMALASTLVSDPNNNAVDCEGRIVGRALAYSTAASAIPSSLSI